VEDETSSSFSYISEKSSEILPALGVNGETSAEAGIALHESRPEDLPASEAANVIRPALKPGFEGGSRSYSKKVVRSFSINRQEVRSAVCPDRLRKYANMRTHMWALKNKNGYCVLYNTALYLRSL
jgi:hypothetical protein